jgi:tripartite-type tricarboxylate transporter receptor subunit TctC
MSGSVRRIFRAALIALLCTIAPAAAAADGAAGYPNGRIDIIVPSGAGGTTDVLARIVGNELAAAWGVPVVVLDQPGAGGIIGAQNLAKARPDGQTIMFVPSAFGVTSAIRNDLPYDPLHDFAGVALVAVAPSLLAVSPTLHVHTLAELIELAKSRSQSITFSSPGVGSTAQLHGALLAREAGIKVLHIPYNSTPAAVQAVMAGSVDYVFAQGTNVLPQAKEGKLVILASDAATRPWFLPDKPTIRELGYPGSDGDWFGALVPAKTSPAIRAKLAQAIQGILQKPEVVKQMRQLGVDPSYQDPQAFDAMLSSYVGEIHTLADKIGLKPM